MFYYFLLKFPCPGVTMLTTTVIQTWLSPSKTIVSYYWSIRSPWCRTSLSDSVNPLASSGEATRWTWRRSSAQSTQTWTSIFEASAVVKRFPAHPRRRQCSFLSPCSTMQLWKEVCPRTFSFCFFTVVSKWQPISSKFELHVWYMFVHNMKSQQDHLCVCQLW